jgi:cysteine synthase
MKKDIFLIIIGLAIFMGVLGACGTIQESEASIRRKITLAVDKASKEIIKDLPKGIKLAVLGGTSSGDDQGLIVAYALSQGNSASEARAFVRQLDKQQISQIAARLRSEGTSQPGNSHADYAVEDLEYNMVKAGFKLVDRQQIERIRNEQQFQMSGEVDDGSAISIGKMVGANAAVVISINYTDKSGRLTLKALDVQTAEIITMARQEF